MYLQKVRNEQKTKKKYFLLASWRSMLKIAGSGSGSGSINQRHGSADPDPNPDPHQNVMDPQHCLHASLFIIFVLPERQIYLCGQGAAKKQQPPRVHTTCVCWPLSEKPISGTRSGGCSPPPLTTKFLYFILFYFILAVFSYYHILSIM